MSLIASMCGSSIVEQGSRLIFSIVLNSRPTGSATTSRAAVFVMPTLTSTGVLGSLMQRVASSRNKKGYVRASLKGAEVRISAGYYIAQTDSLSNTFTLEEAELLAEGLAADSPPHLAGELERATPRRA